MQGLANLGATCAVNSLIQIITREPILRDYILSDTLKNINDDTLLGNLREIIDLMYNKNVSLSPNKFIENLYKHLTIFERGEQIDIGELWIFLFDKIQDEINTSDKCYKKLSNINHTNEIDISDGIICNNKKDFKNILTGDRIRNKYDYVMRKFNNNKISMWTEMLQGFYLNIIKCNECNNSLYNFEPFTSIQLDIIDTDSSITSMIKNFLKEETRCDGWKCDKCNNNTEYTKTIKIWKLPNILFLIVKRFKDVNIKNNSKIFINKKLCFKSGSVLEDTTIDKNYSISSLGLHYGILNGGHYCSLCKSDNKILLYDDLNIKEISEETFENNLSANRDAYMIVYSSQ
uniref:USP domain-containing protein n=1 Tax=viral metagenome TaxID=1070528 RepID=A0A6C0J311_9ZZZZ